MKQFIQDNLFIVVCVAVVVLLLCGIAYPWTANSDARAKTLQMQSLLGQVDGALRNYQSPVWIERSRVGLDKFKAAQEQVIETSLDFAQQKRLYSPDASKFVDVPRDAFRIPTAPGRKGEVQFPVPSNLFAPRDVYIKAIDELKTSVNATTPPGPKEWQDQVAQAIQQLKDRRGAGAPPDQAEEDKRRDQIIQNKVSEFAGTHSLYIGDTSFDMYWKVGDPLQSLTPEQMWQAQLNLWIQQDLIDAIREANSDPRTYGLLRIPAAPIKELVWTSVERDYFPATDKTGGSGPVTPVLTGHVSDNRVDVVHYSFQVVMDVRKLALLVSCLSQQNFHTILNIRMDLPSRKGPIVAGGAAASGPPAAGPAAAPGQPMVYNYGDAPVMAVTCRCEALFMKSPASWRDSSSPDKQREAKIKRLRFFTKHPALALRVLQDGKDLDLGDPGSQRDQAVAKLLDAETRKLESKQTSDVSVIGLYEDLIPPGIRATRPGLVSSAGNSSGGI
ncbi:MAG: hypothetical protein BIFFINMI_04104 [Phycisphaerae bacterium]|nr:hypothetical protein [Phycisphaerae bacterium]